MNTLFPLEPVYPEGFSYVPNFLSVSEEEELCEKVKQMEFSAFLFEGYEAKRRVASFGYDYSFDKGALQKGAPIPGAFKPLVKKVAAHLSIDPTLIVELLITEYPPGAVINWHRDAPPFGLIAGVSLLTDCTFRFRPYEKALQSRSSLRSLSVERRSLYVIQGAARSEWQHSIAAVPRTRYSITLRTLKE